MAKRESRPNIHGRTWENIKTVRGVARTFSVTYYGIPQVKDMANFL